MKYSISGSTVHCVYVAEIGEHNLIPLISLNLVILLIHSMEVHVHSLT